MRIVVFCPNLIGDSVMATPLLRTLRGAYPEGRLDLVARPAVAAALEGAPWFDQVFRHDPRSAEAGCSSRGVVGRLRAVRHDMAILLPNSFRSAWMAWLGGARRRIGYARGGRGLLLTDRLDAPADPHGGFLPTPAVDYYAALLRPLGLRLDAPRLALFTTADDEAAADRACDVLGLGGDRPLVCLNNGGAFGPAKAWPVESFATLARRLATERGAQVLVLCGPAERDAAARTVELAAHPRVVSLADQPLSVGLSKACVRRAALMVTTDSGPRHFAAAFGVPVVSLFGPTHIAWTRTYHPLAVHLQQPVPCGPCQRPTCGEGHHDCMRRLTPGTVFEAAVRLLAERPRAGQPGPRPALEPGEARA